MPEPSNYELARRIDDVRDSVTEGFRAINLNINNLKFVSLDRYNAELETARQRVASLEGEVAEIKADAKWQRRTLITLAAGFVVQLIGGVILLFVALGVGGT